MKEQQRKEQEKQWAWFSPVEMLCVIVTVAILAAIVVPQVSRYRDTIRIKQTQRELNQILHALETYRAQEGQFPSTREGLRALLSKKQNDIGWGGTYPEGRENWLRDPWDRYYVYRRTVRGDSRFLLLSLGPDGKEGTGDDVTA